MRLGSNTFPCWLIHELMNRFRMIVLPLIGLVLAACTAAPPIPTTTLLPSPTSAPTATQPSTPTAPPPATRPHPPPSHPHHPHQPLRSRQPLPPHLRQRSFRSHLGQRSSSSRAMAKI